MSKPEPARYRVTNWSEYNAALRRRGSLLVWLDREMEWLATGSGRPGRFETYSDAAIQFCLSIKVLFGLALRQTMGMVASLLKMAGLDWPVPDYSTLCRRQGTVTIQIPYRRSGGNLNLLVDSTGVKVRGDGEWQVRKHGASRRRQWRKVHLAMDVATGDIRAVEVTPSREGDSPVLPDLLDQIPQDETIGTVTADGAYDTRRCHTAIIERGATAIIPIRKNGRPWKEDSPAARARNEILRASRHFGRALWKRLTGYHARSRAEGSVRQTWLEQGRVPATLFDMTQRSPFRYFKTSPEVIRLAVMLYVRFPLSLRNVEDLLHERGIEVSHETVRFWWQRFGPMFAAEIRRRRVGGLRSSRWRWHLDEVFVKINGVQHYLWRAVDHEGEVLEAFVSKTRDRKSALKFLRKLMKRHGRPEELVTDKLRSYGAALKELGIQGRRVTDRWENNRAENSHQPFRRRERAMLRFRRMRSLQKFASVHGSVHNHFNSERTLTDRTTYKAARTAALAEWRVLCAA